MRSKKAWRAPVLLVAGLLLLIGLAAPPARAASAPIDGSSVYLGTSYQVGNSPGNLLVPIYVGQDAAEGEPDFWAYCIENQETRRTDRDGIVGDWASFVGSNYFANDPVAARKVAWILVHSYPSLTVAELSAASGVDGLTSADAIDATQYAIWRYTELDFDAGWSFDNDRAEDLYWYLLTGANEHGGLTEAQLADLGGFVTLTGPTDPQVPGTLAGPITVSTDRPSASVTVDPTVTVTDGVGVPVDLSAVVDGQELFLDLRDVHTSGAAEIVATIASSAGTGMVVSVDADLSPRSQSLILVSAAGATASASTTVGWTAVVEPSIGTTVSVVGSEAKVLPLTGGTVIDRVAYEGLTPGVEHVVSGSIRTAPDGAETGITSSTTFVPTESSGFVEVTFEITAPQVADLAGRDLVVFERVTVGDDLVAEHADPTDQDQTFSVAEEPVEPTTTTSTRTSTSTSTTTGPTTTAGAGGVVGSSASGSGSLPRTGFAGTDLALVAIGLIVSGAAVAAVRRRSTRT